ncbi:MAG: hypothetical protein DI628_05275 [Blastochloris viridis]|uniref:Uncharacterized protein n=1 Tax=Blastochloris viridis TaxID=1079 RepID=A0A6N4RDH4_BLAVI|nr:MAG: hypothetical protein DI628_05275 [Blastochloris viridis]
MAINTTRLASALAGLWAVLALPMTQSLPNVDGLIDFTFWYAVLLYPVWVIYGWRWVSEGTTVPRWLLFSCLGMAFVVVVMLLNSRTPEYALMSLLTMGVITLLVFTLEGIPPALKNIHRKPPQWLIVIIALICAAFAVAFAKSLTPLANMICLVFFGLSWGGYKLFKLKKITMVEFCVAFVLAGSLMVAVIIATWPQQQSLQPANTEEYNKAISRAVAITAGEDLPPDCKDLMQRFPHTAPFMKGCEHLRQPSVAPEPLRISE